jgi:hypothetical protein
MIVGNPNAGMRMASAVVKVLLMIVVITIIVSLRKKTAPVKSLPSVPPRTNELDSFVESC